MLGLWGNIVDYYQDLEWNTQVPKYIAVFNLHRKNLLDFASISKLTSNPEYAQAAAKILTSWGEKLSALDTSDDQYLTAGLQGYQLVNAAELIRDYTPFAASGLSTFTSMFSDVILSKNIFFLNHQAPSEHNIKHFHANWELANMASVMAFGVLTDNSTLFDYAVDYFKTGEGNGAINNAITNIVKEPGTGTLMGQPQEAGRDQGHTALDIQLFGVIAQQAWNQGEDLYAYNSSRILQGTEYFSRYNLGQEVPFEPWTNYIVNFTIISEASRGAVRPTFELLYAHYAQIKGVEAPWTGKYRDYVVEGMGGFEGGAGSLGEGSGHFDGVGWGSLLYRLDEGDVEGASIGTKSLTSSTSTSSIPVASSSSTLKISTSSSPSSTTASPSVSSAPSVESATSTGIQISTSSSSTLQPTTLATATAKPTAEALPTSSEDLDACSPQ